MDFEKLSGRSRGFVKARMRQAVFLDRDGTINHNEVRDGKPIGPTMLEDFHILPGVAEATARFRAAGFLVIVVTNQPDLTTEKNWPEIMAAMHMRLRGALAVDDIMICPHTVDAGCGCRKPKPGLLLQAAEKWGVDLAHSIMVGDRWRDIDAGRAAGCLTVHIDNGYTGEPTVGFADLVVPSLETAAGWICAQHYSSTN